MATTVITLEVQATAVTGRASRIVVVGSAAAGPAGANGAAGADGVGVPTGGTTGQVLAKSSTTDYATAWQAPGLETYRDSNRLLWSTIPAATQVVISGTRAAHPYWVPSTGIDCSGIACRVITGATSAVIRLGIYSADPTTGYPTSLIINAGTINAETSGDKIASIDSTFIPSGMVWLVGWLTGGSPNMVLTSHVGVGGPVPFPQASLAPSTTHHNGISMPGSDLTVDAPLPSTYPSGGSPGRWQILCHLRFT